MKTGDLVKYISDGRWEDWYGIVIREIPGTGCFKMVMWFRGDNVVTTTQESDLELISEKNR